MIRAWLQREFYSRDLGVLLYQERFSGGRSIVKPVEFLVEDYDEMQIVNPTFRLTHEAVQDIVNQAAEMKIKPESSHKLEGLLEATKYHLEDLRLIAKLRK